MAPSIIEVKKLRLFLSLLLLLATVGLLACRHDAPSQKPTSPAAATTAVHRQELLDQAIENLNCLEEFGSADVLQQIFDRLDPQTDPKSGAKEQQLDPLLAASPEPEMLGQIIERLNQWGHDQPPAADWKRDPMLAALPESLRQLPQLKNLGRQEFTLFDGYCLQEAIWLRDISNWARGDVLDDLDRAKNVFDWTIRNIQIEPDRADRTPQFPWETLMFGRGTATERAWAFILLLRQLDLDAAILAVDSQESTADGPEQKAAKASGPAPTEPKNKKIAADKPPHMPSSKHPTLNPRPWCVGVLIEGEIYLFDPVLGLPIPAANGVARNAEGRLTIQPATLAQVIADPKLLHRLDVDASHKYSIEARDLQRVTPLIEASPSYLAERMKLLESQLRGVQRLVLTTAPIEHAERWKAAKHVAAAKLWLLPFETLNRRSHLDAEEAKVHLTNMLPFCWLHEERVTVRNRDDDNPSEEQRVVRAAALGQGRVLHLKNKLAGDTGAIHYYQMARPSNQRLLASSVSTDEKLINFRGKQDATYWLALIAYERGKHDAAIDYLTNRTRPSLISAESLWARGARYNLGRTYEASGQIDKAIAVYRNGPYGDLLRAKWLAELSR
ncbi:MAG: hypothetical protein LLG00_05465 [Planctomycetaceae bacterium]|nr:hypothetical protein [Planctomycetaceae bacterium]